MKIDEWTSEDVHTSGGGEFPPCAGLTSKALFPLRVHKQGCPPEMPI